MQYGVFPPMSNQEGTTGMVRTPVSSSDCVGIPNWMFGEGKPEIPGLTEAGIKLEWRYNELINRWSLAIKLDDKTNTRISNCQNDTVYMFNDTITVYDIRDTAKISVLTDRKHKYERYQEDGKKHRRYTWGE